MQHTIDIDKLKKGDPVTFKLFFELLYPKLMALACRFVNEQTAKDLVQEVFTVYWEKKKDIDADNIQSYMYKWIQNNCLNFLKHQLVIEEYESRIRIAESRIAFLENTTDTNDVLKQVMTQDIIDRIHEALQLLPPKCAQVFELCYFKELSHKEIAEQMQISTRTVEGHIRHAVLFLRKQLRHIITFL